jgi:hypothetical protein
MNFLENSLIEFKVGQRGIKVNFKLNNLISDFYNKFFTIFFHAIK